MEVAELLRGLAVMVGPFPRFDVEGAPERPGELFVQWLAQAVREDVVEPHVVTLSTADERGRPSSRVLMLRDVDAERAGWVFASSALSRKGVELSRNPWAAMTMYWTEQGRQVRVSGRVEAADPETGRRAFLQRPEPARLAGLIGRQSAPMADLAQFDAADREARELLRGHPEAVPPDFTVYTLWADEVEFWQGDPERRHIRLRYERVDEGAADGWRKELLWP
ncbi:pyridoxine/pyridoxamine 5'-phosphate oxidase [Wenjunlia tyrosinilytica]|uniref:Pyridoxamine 5'-phosphate oxidase n=1 Tax=Wenjunlia tyrosinilytica TaxID=1544741 RepID=A0A917ZKB7_9ACTN|nr:pyridoxal 5'-phosphate synthase [Wenjunlia tyrosinilytica]GGO84483.1 pyridoxamine 5'-phosphate oxidase [Wenjunlia tyrosinilytica]